MRVHPIGCLTGIVTFIIAIVVCILVITHAAQISDFFVTHVFEFINNIGG